MRTSIGRWTIVLPVLSGALMVGQVRAQAPKTADHTPIIAAVVAEPDLYEGKTVSIYGLVIKVDPVARTFLLQDVSQRPLLVRNTTGPDVSEGDQLQIEGPVHRSASEIWVAADKVGKVRVLAGGGCC
jgi:hypothetical protein